MSSNEKDFTGNLKKSGKLKLWAMSLVVLCLLIGGAVAVWATGSVSNLYVTPNPIKIGQTAYVKYTLGQAGYVTIKIYDANNNLVRTVISNISKAANNYSQVWDGKNNSGVLVPDGNYKFVVEARETADPASNVLGSAEFTAPAAQQPSITAASDSPDPINPLNGEQTTISYTISSDALVTVTIVKGTTPVRTLMSSQLKSAGANSITWDGKDSSGNAVADGPYYYQIDVVSPVVSTFKSTYKVNTVSVEKEAPRVTDYTATPDPFKISVSNMSIRYTLSEACKVTLKIVDNSGTAVRTILNAVAQNAGTLSSAWDGKNDSGSYVPEGNYSVVLSAVDNFNKPSGDQTIGFKAGYQPTVSGLTVTPAVFNPADPLNALTTVNYTLSQRGLVTIQILNGYDLVKVVANNQDTSAGTYSFTWDGKDESGNVVGDADYTIKISAVSTTVSTFSSSVTGTATVEKGAPGIYEVTLSPEPFKLGTTGVITIRYSLSENSTVDINVYRDNTLVRQLVAGAAKPVGANTATWDGKDGTGADVPEGIYTVTIKAVDKYGNAADLAQNNVTCGYLPAISNASALPNPYDVLNGSAAINFELSKSANVTVTILKGTNPIRTIAAGILAQGVNSIVWDGKDQTGLVVADGPYTYQIDAVSPTVSTLLSTYKGTITVETRNPELASLSVSPSTVKIGANTTLRYAISEPATVTVQVVKTDGSAVKDFAPVSKTSEGSYSVIWDTKDNSGTLITTGTYKLKVTAVDGAGKSVAAELAFPAGAVPQITNHSANPTNLDISQGITTTTISYTVDQDSLVTLKLLDADGVVWKTLFRDKPVNGQDTVSVNVYENGDVPPTSTISYSIQAASAVGYFKSLIVTGAIQVAGIPNAPMDCRSCHAGYPQSHPMSNCAGCHGNDEPIQDCAKCHTANTGHQDGSVLSKFKCEYCHTEAYSYKIPGHGEITTLHNSTLGIDCQKCHDPNLTIEHPRHTYDVTGVAMDCNTCHKPIVENLTVEDVVYATSNGLTNCNACHGESNHLPVHDTTILDTNCDNCHINNLVTEHLNNPTTQTGNSWTCDTCHISTNQVVIGAVYTDDKQCAACHGSAHNMNLAELPPADIPLYAGYTWAPPQNAFLWAGESWMPDEYLLGGKVLISNRMQVSGATVYDWYIAQMAANGWAGISAVPADMNFWNISFTKGTHKCMIWFYGGVGHTASPVLDAGYRLEVIYK